MECCAGCGGAGRGAARRVPGSAGPASQCDSGAWPVTCEWSPSFHASLQSRQSRQSQGNKKALMTGAARPAGQRTKHHTELRTGSGSEPVNNLGGDLKPTSLQRHRAQASADLDSRHYLLRKEGGIKGNEPKIAYLCGLRIEQKNCPPAFRVLPPPPPPQRW